MKLSSPAFTAMGPIPRTHTCEGEDVSPPLQWTEMPVGTRSYALIVQDPDAPDPAAPQRVWVHWVLFDIPGDVHALTEGAAADLPAGARHGINDWGKPAWGGPCPPIGRHRYFFNLYALDAALPELQAPTRAALEAALAGHILARAELIGTYQKQAHGSRQTG